MKKKTIVKGRRKRPSNLGAWAKDTLRDHKRRGFEIYITFSDIIEMVKRQNFRCRYCGTRFDLRRGVGYKLKGPSLDLIFNEDLITLARVATKKVILIIYVPTLGTYFRDLLNYY